MTFVKMTRNSQNRVSGGLEFIFLLASRKVTQSRDEFTFLGNYGNSEIYKYNMFHVPLV